MYNVNIVNAGDYSFNVKSKDYEFIVDVKGKGITPPDTLLASLGTCVGIYVRKYSEGAKLTLPEFVINVAGELSKEPPFCFRKINVNLDLKDVMLDERRQRALHEFVKNCPVHNTLKNNPEIEIEIK
ncbi:MAG: OsmC family protein [Candidatus Omnitrophota bacterium]